MSALGRVARGGGLRRPEAAEGRGSSLDGHDALPASSAPGGGSPPRHPPEVPLRLDRLGCGAHRELRRAAGPGRRGRRGALPGFPKLDRHCWAHARKSRGLPSKAMAPAFMAITRSAAARQRSRRCSARRIVTPHSSLRRRRSQISSSPATGSSWDVGSSSRTSFGRVTRAAARATRCSSPPESVSTVRPSRCGIARARATSSTARARDAGGSPRISSGSSISAATVVETTWVSGSWAT